MNARKHYPLPKRFYAAVSEAANSQIRDLSDEYGFGNNYVLTILLENLNSIAKPEALRLAFQKFTEACGAPSPGGMERGKAKKFHPPASPEAK